MANDLRETIARELPRLRGLTEAQASAVPEKPGAWCGKDELGHLIDSAANNHVRFVRAVLEGGFEGAGYAQDDWVRLHGYRGLPWLTLVDLWQQYNTLLAHLVARIPAESLVVKCKISSGAAVTLGFLIDDYVLHMQHHIDHILGRDIVTPYPAVASDVP